MDYEVQRSARRCSTSGREFAPGEEFYSVLVADGAELRRYDFAVDVWQGPPSGALGWWKSQVPDRNAGRGHHAKRGRGAPNDVLLSFFDELGDGPDRQETRYVLALLLVRRRVFRLEEERRDPVGRETLVLYCPRRDATYEIPAVAPEGDRAEQIQQELARLLEG
ncbi:MAG: hypothetical protein ABR915_02185 [Thermoguttaceae bacterium]|jgi:hypothetical protein